MPNPESEQIRTVHYTDSLGNRHTLGFAPEAPQSHVDAAKENTPRYFAWLNYMTHIRELNAMRPRAQGTPARL